MAQRRPDRRAGVDDVDAGGPAALDPEVDAESVGRAVVLRKLASAPQTRAQLDEAMAKKDVPDHIREQILGRFADVGLIDDAAFARAWVESRHAGRGLAKRALTHELRRRGVDPAVADEAAGLVPAEREEEMARALVARRLPGTRRLDPAARTRRLAAMLARKGYSPGLSYRVIREALHDDGVDADTVPDDLDSTDSSA